MRRFASDLVPGLRFSRSDLPEPWILPWTLSRQHKERLVSLLARALQGFDVHLQCSQIRWVERDSLQNRRIRLPASTLLWWHVEAIGSPPSETVVLSQSTRLWKGMAVYDIEAPSAAQSVGWLGAFKVQLLHRLLDVCRDDSSCDGDDELLSTWLRRLAELPLTPVELLDCADILWDSPTQGRSLEDSYAFGLGLTLASRFPPISQGDGAADEIIQTLRKVTADDQLSSTDQALLMRAGLWELDESTPPSILEVLRDKDILRQTILQLANSRGLKQSLSTLAPNLFQEEAAIDFLCGGAYEVSQTWSSKSVFGMTATLGGPSTSREPLLARIERMLVSGSPTQAGRELVAAMKDREVLRWAQNDQERTAELLLKICEILDPIQQGAYHDTDLIQVAVFARAAADLLSSNNSRARKISAIQARGWAAERLRLADQLDSAEAQLTQALIEAKRLDDTQGEADTCRLLGDLRQRQYDPEKALSAYMDALAIYERLNDIWGRASTLRSIGDLKHKLDYFAEARTALEEAGRLFGEIGNTAPSKSREHLVGQLGRAHVLRSMGNLLFRQNEDPIKAADVLNEAMTLYQSMNNHLGQANTHRSMGNLKLLHGDLAGARTHYESALPLFQQTGNRLGQANTLGSLGNLRLRQNDLVGAQGMYEAALELYVQIGDSPGRSQMQEAIENIKRLRV